MNVIGVLETIPIGFSTFSLSTEETTAMGFATSASGLSTLNADADEESFNVILGTTSGSVMADGSSINVDSKLKFILRPVFFGVEDATCKGSLLSVFLPAASSSELTGETNC